MIKNISIFKYFVFALFCVTVTSNQFDPTQWLVNAHDLSGSTSQPLAFQLNKHNAAHLKLVWNTSFASAVEGAPVIKNGVVYAPDDNSDVTAYNLHTGAPLWSVSIGSGGMQNAAAIPFGQLPVSNKVYVSGGGIDGFASTASLAQNTGNIQWETIATPGNSITDTAAICPIVVNGLIIVGSDSCEETCAVPIGNGKYNFTFASAVYAYNATTGDLVWTWVSTGANSTDSPGSSVGYSFAADVERGMLFLGTGNSYTTPESPKSCSIVALDIATGTERWVTKLNYGCIWSIQFPNAIDLGLTGFPRDLDVGTYPQLFTIEREGKLVDVVGATDKSRTYTIMTRNNGTILWRVPLIPQNINPSLGGTPGSAYLNGVVYTIGLYDPLNMVTPAVSIGAALGNLADIVTVINGYTAGLRSTVTALDANTGVTLWQNTYPGVMFGSPSVSGSGILAVGGFSGQLYVLDANTGAELVPPFSTQPDPILSEFAGRTILEPICTVVSIVDGGNVQLVIGTGFFFSGGRVYAFGV